MLLQNSGSLSQDYVSLYFKMVELFIVTASTIYFVAIHCPVSETEPYFCPQVKASVRSNR
jgi:hypothetical protein